MVVVVNITSWAIGVACPAGADTCIEPYLQLVGQWTAWAVGVVCPSGSLDTCSTAIGKLVTDSVESILRMIETYCPSGITDCVQPYVDLAVAVADQAFRDGYRAVCGDYDLKRCADEYNQMVESMLQSLCRGDSGSGSRACIDLAVALADKAVKDAYYALCEYDDLGRCADRYNETVHALVFQACKALPLQGSGDSYGFPPSLGPCVLKTLGLVHYTLITVCQSSETTTCVDNLLKNIDRTLQNVCEAVPVEPSDAHEGGTPGSAMCVGKTLGLIEHVMRTLCQSTYATTCIDNLLNTIDEIIRNACQAVPVEPSDGHEGGTPGSAMCVGKTLGLIEHAMKTVCETTNAATCVDNLLNTIDEIIRNACQAVPVEPSDGHEGGTPGTALCVGKTLGLIEHAMKTVCETTNAATCVDNLVRTIDTTLGNVCGTIPVEPSGESSSDAGAADPAPEGSSDNVRLGVQAEDGLLRWESVDADCYRVVDPYEKIFFTTTETTFPHPGVVTGDNFSVTVAAIRNNDVVAIERLRGSTIARGNLHTPTVQHGMELLAAMFVRTTPTTVEFELPPGLLSVVDGWKLYRNGNLVDTAGPGVGRIIDTTPGPPLSSVTYSVQLLAPDWTTPYDDAMAWMPALETACVADADECPSSIADPGTLDPSSVDPDHEVAHLTAASEEDVVIGDLLTAAIPVEIPEMSDPLRLELLVPPQPGDGKTTSSSSGSICRDYWTSPCLDDAFVYHRTFVPEEYIDTPEPAGCWWCTNYAFGGDDRDFGRSLNSSTRTRVTVRMDWEGVWRGKQAPTYTRDVTATKRYVILPDGTYKHESTKTGVNNPTVQYIAHTQSRYRIRVRHSAKNPYENYYPAIDYEWEYVMTRDGGITTRGLHDGAPNYEDFYRAPFSEGPKRVYTHEHTSFTSLAPPMDQKGRSWCRSGCPYFGTARWV
jgi:hypothetical protein